MADSPRIEELRRRVQVDPASIAFAALAEEYRRAGRYEEAIATCQAGLQRHPAYLSARVTLGRALLQLERYAEAREELEHVLRAAPENLAAIRGLAEIHHRRGELPEALEQYKSALNVAKHDAEIEDAVDRISRQVGPPTNPGPAAPAPIAVVAGPVAEAERRFEPPPRPHLELVKGRGSEEGSGEGSEGGSEGGSAGGSEGGSERGSESGSERVSALSELQFAVAAESLAQPAVEPFSEPFFSEPLSEPVSEPPSEPLSEPPSEPPPEPLSDRLADPTLPALESFLAAILREKNVLTTRSDLRS